MAIFITISILLHLLSMLAIAILYQRRSLERLNLPTMQEDVETIYQSMAAFTEEIEQENERLYEQLRTFMQKKEAIWEKRIKELEDKLQLQAVELQGAQEANGVQHELAEVKQVLLEDNQEQIPSLQQQSQYEQVRELYTQGFSVEHIAQVLQIGKGETALIVNIIKKNHPR